MAVTALLASGPVWAQDVTIGEGVAVGWGAVLHRFERAVRWLLPWYGAGKARHRPETHGRDSRPTRG